MEKAPGCIVEALQEVAAISAKEFRVEPQSIGEATTTPGGCTEVATTIMATMPGKTAGTQTPTTAGSTSGSINPYTAVAKPLGRARAG